MAYRPKQFGLVRDKTYPSEIAAQRPALATRIQCESTEEFSPSDHPEYEREGDASTTLRGDREEGRCAMFNRTLRSGHGFRNDGEE